VERQIDSLEKATKNDEGPGNTPDERNDNYEAEEVDVSINIENVCWIFRKGSGVV
jgi:hypothetical protein